MSPSQATVIGIRTLTWILSVEMHDDECGFA
jgi:hypothetical protein